MSNAHKKALSAPTLKAYIETLIYHEKGNNMNNNIIVASYNDAITVDFTLDAWFNATEVAKKFSKQAKEWLRLDSTKEYMDKLIEIQKRDNPAFDINQLISIKKGAPGTGGGSWFHPKLAVPFARWLDVGFSIWCDMQIEKILHPMITQSLPPKAPRAKTAIPGGLSLQSQDLINDTIAERLTMLPKEKQSGAAIQIRSAILTKYDLKGTKHGYKNIPDDQVTNVINLIARLPLEADHYVTYTREELTRLISQTTPTEHITLETVKQLIQQALKTNQPAPLPSKHNSADRKLPVNVAFSESDLVYVLQTNGYTVYKA